MPRPIAHKGTPFWHYDFVRKGRRFHGSTGTASRPAAQAFVDRLLAKIASGELEREAEAARRPSLTVDEALGAYWTEVAAEQPSARTTWSQMRALIAGLGDDAKAHLHELTAERLHAYRRARRATVSDATVNRDLQCLRRVVRWAAKARGVRAPEIDWPALMRREPQGRTRWLSGEEEARLFAALRPDLHPLLTFALRTGVRLAGARTLTWDRVDLRKRAARVRLKGGGWLDVPLTAELVALITAQPKVAPQVFTWFPRRGKVRRPITQDGWRKSWAAALAAAEIEDFRWHDARHTAATRLLEASGNLRLVQHLLGHRSIQSTARYAHVETDQVREAMERAASRNSPEVPTDEKVKPLKRRGKSR